MCIYIYIYIHICIYVYIPTICNTTMYTYNRTIYNTTICNTKQTYTTISGWRSAAPAGLPDLVGRESCPFILQFKIRS